MDELQAWERFVHSGRVEDYLSYTALKGQAPPAVAKGAIPYAESGDRPRYPGALGE